MMVLLFYFILQGACQRFALPALGRAAGRRPTGKMLRRRKMLGIAPESPASGARFVRRFALNTTNIYYSRMRQSECYFSLVSRDFAHVKIIPKTIAKRNEVSQSMVLAP